MNPFVIVAEGDVISTSVNSIMTSLTSGLSTVASAVTGSLGNMVLPGLSIAGAYLAVRFGKKFFKIVSK